MAIYDLDQNEEIDFIKINWVEYLVWDIPILILQKIKKIKVWKNSIKQRKDICKEILSIRNWDVNIYYITKDKLMEFILCINNKIEKWQVW